MTTTGDQRIRNGLTRRETLKRGALGLGVVSTGGLLAACNDDGGATTAGAQAGSAQKRGGTLRVGFASGGSGGSIDPDVGAQTTVDWARFGNVYDRLMVDGGKDELVPSLAEEVSSDAKAEVWTIRLREGVEFHDGRPLEAEDLIYSLRRHTQSKSNAAPFLTAIDRSQIRKRDTRTVELRLNRPDPLLDSILFSAAGVVLPRDFNPKKPIGTGPFRVVSFEPGKVTRLARNENYFDSVLPDKLEIIEFADDVARTNALLAGQVDAIESLPTSQVKAVEANPNLQTVIHESASYRPFVMNMSVPPFDDARVTKAMRLIADREELINRALDGQGVIGNDVFGRFDSVYIGDTLPQREQDIEQAKSLLKDAGHENLTLELTTSDIASGIIEASTVFVQQAEAAGVTIKLKRVPASDFFGDDWLTYPFTVANWSSGRYWTSATYSLAKDALYPQTHFNDDEWQALYEQAVVEADSARRHELAAEMQRIEYERGGYIIWGFPNIVGAASKDVTGFREGHYAQPMGDLAFRTVSFV